MTFLDMKNLETERLVLRKIQKSDACDMYEYAKNPQTSKYLTWSPHHSLSYTTSYIKYLLKKYKSGEYFDWAVVLKTTGKFIGTCGFSSFSPENKKVEVGYVINPEYQKNGYATEAVKAVISFAFDELDFHRIEAKCIKENLNSENVLKKCGFTLEGIGTDEMLIKNEFKTILHFAKIND